MWSSRRGAVLCAGCGKIVGASETRCPHCGRAYPALFGLAPWLRGLPLEQALLTLVLWGCGALYAASLVIQPGAVRSAGFNLLSPGVEAMFLLGASGAVPVYGYGRWWTVLSATWLHGGVLHIVFNMLWVRDLMPAAARLYGPGRTILLYVVAGALGFVASSTAGAFLVWLPGPLSGGRVTLGASAAVFGLLGALMAYGRRTGVRVLRGSAWGWVLVLGLWGFMMPGIDNWAHAGGFAGGYGLGWLLDPRTPERPGHVLAGLLALAASLLAVIASVVLGRAIVGAG